MRVVPIVSLAATLGACSGGGGGSATDAAPPNFDRRALVRHVAADLLAPTYARFAVESAAVTTATTTYCSALGTGDGATELAAARAAWATAIDTWELLDAVQVGPVVQDNGRLRSRIYAWPLLAPCTLDQDVVARQNAPASYDVTTRLDNARSLSAIEYLLFHTDPISSCPIAPTGWDTLGAALPRARCELAAVIAADVATHGDQLATAWSATGGDYPATLATVEEREAVNMISDGLFYVDRLVKDMKLGEAAGIVINSCGTIEEPCLREAEHRFADRGSPAIRINLRALRDVFTGDHGGGGLGFDDYLIAVGAADVATRMTTNLDAVVAAADALPDGYLAALTTDRARVVALHAATKLVTDDMKSQFLTVLGLDIPADVAGDND
jgi:predicted lipoprotein